MYTRNADYVISSCSHTVKISIRHEHGELCCDGGHVRIGQVLTVSSDDSVKRNKRCLAQGPVRLAKKGTELVHHALQHGSAANVGATRRELYIELSSCHQSPGLDCGDACHHCIAGEGITETTARRQ